MNVRNISGALMAVILVLAPSLALAVQPVQDTAGGSAKWGFMGAALAVAGSTIGAGIAVGLVGAAAMGAISERPEVAGRALIFLGLAEGIAIYGLIIAIMILGKI